MPVQFLLYEDGGPPKEMVFLTSKMLGTLIFDADRNTYIYIPLKGEMTLLNETHCLRARKVLIQKLLA